MKDLLIYQLEVAACITVFYLFYWLFLRKETNFNFRRIYMIAASMLAILLPLLNIQFSAANTEIPINYLNFIPQQIIYFSPQVEQASELTPDMIFSLIWVIGLAIMALRLLASVYYVTKIVKEAIPQQQDQKIKLTAANIQSFSFFKTIVLSQAHYHSKAMKYILAHEQAHSDQYHSLDVLLMEVLKSVQWFNPAAWLFANEAIQNLEYLADQKVVHTLSDKQAYQMAIVQFAHQQRSKLLRSEFSKSNLKNRIIMLNQPNNQKIKAWKFVLLLPVIGALLMSFSIKIDNLDLKKEVTQMLPIINESVDLFPIAKDFKNLTIQKDSADKVYTIVNNQPVPVNGMTSYYEVINKSLTYPAKSKEQGIEGKVYVEFIVRKDGQLSNIKVVQGIAEDCDEEAIRVITNGPKWIPGKQDGENVSVRLILPVTFSLSKVNKDKAMNTTDNGESSGNENSLSLDVNNPAGQPTSPLYIVNSKEISKSEFEAINPESIESINVLKDASAEQKYGEKGKNGVVEIKLKNNFSSQSTLNSTGQALKIGFDISLLDKNETEPEINTGIKIRETGKIGIATENPPLIYKDGVEISLEEMEKIDPQSINSIEVTKDKMATEKYGEKGKNGVIVISMLTPDEIKEKQKNQLDQLPTYKEGMDAFYKTIQKKVKYPKEARDKNIQGQVFISFTVNKEGKIEDISADETKYTLLNEIVVVGYASSENKDPDKNKDLSLLEQEVAEVIKQLNDFTPGIQNGKPVDVRMTLPVTFKLD